MMRVATNMSRGSVGFNMTPMIDVVFLLIVFFLVSSHLAQQETQLELSLPSAQSGQQSVEDETRRIIVNVLPFGQIMVGGKTLEPNELTKLIGYESRRTERHLEVRIRSDRKVPYGLIKPILVDCARSGVWKVTFAVVSGS